MVLISKKWRVIYVGYGGASVGPSFATEREASKFLYDTRGAPCSAYRVAKRLDTRGLSAR